MIRVCSDGKVALFDGEIYSSNSCCTDIDGETYVHPCGCPSASFDCDSEQFNYELCGWVEAEDPPGIVPSVPPKKYRKLTVAYSGVRDTGTSSCFGETFKPFVSTFSGSSVQTVDINTCDVNVVSDVTDTVETCFCNTLTEEPECSTSVRCCFVTDPRPFNTWYVFNSEVLSTTSTITYNDIGDPDDDRQWVHTLTEEDTESDAEARAEGVDGTSCSSRWETRDTEFDWIKRTSEYTITCNNLIDGLSYFVKPVIRRRTAQDNGSGTWEDVLVSGTTFTASSDTEIIGPVSLPSTQGWEYQITGVGIELS